MSVVIPARDAAAFLADAVSSVKAQGYPALELIVVDDGSVDATAAVAAQCAGVGVIRQANAGPAAARNTGIAVGRGDVLAFLDADDLWPVGRLHAMVARLRDDAAADVVLGRTRRIAWDAAGRTGDGDLDGTTHALSRAPDATARDADCGDGIAALFPYSIGAAVYRRRAFERVGLFDPSLRFGEDQDWFLRARERGVVVAVLDDVVEIKRRHAGNMTRGKSLVELGLPAVLKRRLERGRAARDRARHGAQTDPCRASPAPDADDTPALRFFRVATAAGRRAMTACGTIERRYAIAGDELCVRFAGPALLAHLAPALEHLRLPDDAPRAEHVLTVDAWDSTSSGAAMPPPPWSAADYLPRGEIRAFNDARVRTVHNLGDGALRMIDLAAGSGLFWTRDPATLPEWEHGAPLRTIIHWWTSARGRQLVHAAAIGRGGRGVLLTARGGSGKSTAALACVEAGFEYVGDDYVLVVDGDDGPRAASLYSTAKLAVAQLARFPALRALAMTHDGRGGTKAIVPLHPARGTQIRPSLAIDTILVPRITGRPETMVREAPAAASLAALAPTTVFQLPGDAERTFARAAALARAVPTRWLDLGTDLAQIPRVIAAVLDGTR